jgi:hypothetical protein
MPAEKRASKGVGVTISICQTDCLHTVRFCAGVAPEGNDAIDDPSPPLVMDHQWWRGWVHA